MKIRFFIFLLFIIPLGQLHQAFGQQSFPPFGKMIRFSCTVTEAMRVFQITAQSVSVSDTAVDDLFKPFLLKDKIISPILLGVKLNPKLINYELSPVKSFSKSYAAFRISDQSDAVLIALGITKYNIADYRYHVVLNDSTEVVSWSKIPKLIKSYGAKMPFGFIGKFNYPGKQVMIEVVNIKSYQIRDGVIFDWRKNIKPVLSNIIVSGPQIPVKINLKQLQQKKAPYSLKHDPRTGLVTEIKFVQDSISSFRLIFKEHQAIAYNVSITNADNNDHSFFSQSEGDDLQYSFGFNSLPRYPGNYDILIRPQVSGGVDIKGQQLRIRVVILPVPLLSEKVSLSQLLPYVITVLILGGLLFAIVYRRNQVKLLHAAQEKQTAGLKLQSIRAQLNPHFMFNALTSIQNLVNKNDIAGANHYLAKFAGLTRQVLDTGNEELLSLEQELAILDDYLQMEQLRFGFKYEITADPGLNKANIEIPAMLLQPFVENAVKHGVAVLKEQGRIEVSVTRQGQDIIFAIKDNGKWTATDNPAEISGYGLKLSQERVALLNQLYKDQSMSLQIDKQGPGTVVSIRLSNWI